MQVLDLDVATSFLLIAATLVDLKGPPLAPQYERRRHRRRVRAVGRTRHAACASARSKDVLKTWPRSSIGSPKKLTRLFRVSLAPTSALPTSWPDMLEGTSLKRFQNAAIKALTPRPKPIVDLFHVDPIKITVADAVSELIDELPRAGRISFRDLTAQFADRIDVIVRFLALLELFKQGAIELNQTERFGDIDVIWSMGRRLRFQHHPDRRLRGLT